MTGASTGYLGALRTPELQRTRGDHPQLTQSVWGEKTEETTEEVSDAIDRV